jgi:putative spermidine/putrescine transport system ATP-binding protein
MDEPLGALDKQLREQMQYEIKHIHERLGVTIVYVTHDQSEALTMSNRIAVFNDGVVQQLSTPDELYERPENSFVAQFIGENNKLKGTVTEIGRFRRFGKSSRGKGCKKRRKDYPFHST